MEQVSGVASHIIGKFGGPEKFAETLGISVTQAYRMTYPATRGGTGGVIHPKYHARLFEAAREQQIDLTPSDFFEPSVISPPEQAPAASTEAA